MYVRSYYLQQLSLRQLKSLSLIDIEIDIQIEMEYLVATLLDQFDSQC